MGRGDCENDSDGAVLAGRPFFQGAGMRVPASVVTYFNPLLHLAVMRVYGNKIAEARQHPLTKRRYMWKLTY